MEKYNVPLPAICTSANASKTKDEHDFTVRGRAFDQTKPITFNQVIPQSTYYIEPSRFVSAICIIIRSFLKFYNNSIQ